jgi:hypothetical protein
MGALALFWIVGYILGAAAWLVRAPVIQFIETFGLNADATQALLAGLLGSTVMVVGILFWSFLSSSS